MIDNQQPKNVNIFSGTPYIAYLMKCTHMYCMGSPQGYNIYLINFGPKVTISGQNMRYSGQTFYYTSDAQAHSRNNCSLHVSFVRLMLYFDINTQMALQASFTRSLFILRKH